MSKAGYIVGTKTELRISEYAANQSVLFMGGSGNGKTVAMKKISQNMNEDGWKVLVFNFNGTHDDILSDSQNYNVIRVKKEGVPLPLFERYSSQNGEKEDEADVCESVVEAFSQVTKMGYKAKYLLNQACHDAMGMHNVDDDMRCLHKAILSLEDDEKTSLLAKYSYLITRVRFRKKVIYGSLEKYLCWIFRVIHRQRRSSLPNWLCQFSGDSIRFPVNRWQSGRFWCWMSFRICP